LNEQELRQALRVYLVADPEQCFGDFLTQVEDGLRGGVTMVQLRAKNLTDRGLYAMAIDIRDLCQTYGAAFLVNDRVDIALAAGADGVHLGVDDVPIEAAREIAPPGFMIGFSPDTNDLAARAKARGVDYLGVGPVYETQTKADAGPEIGVRLLAKRVDLSGLPVIGIGGITAEKATPVIEAGACGVAVISAILKAGDARVAAQRLRAAVDGALTTHHA
jgi:thiamine-phosphate diphosphorylase